jgi:hypothetical protein
MEDRLRIEARRKWSVTEEAALMAEVDGERGRVTLVARRHEILESLLRKLRGGATSHAIGFAEKHYLEWCQIPYLAHEGFVPAFLRRR